MSASSTSDRYPRQGARPMVMWYLRSLQTVWRAPHEWAGARAGQSIRWASATMIPSGPRTYAMRQMCSY